MTCGSWDSTEWFNKVRRFAEKVHRIKGSEAPRELTPTAETWHHQNHGLFMMLLLCLLWICLVLGGVAARLWLGQARWGYGLLGTRVAVYCRRPVGSITQRGQGFLPRDGSFWPPRL